MKVVINNCWGGFGVSEVAVKWMREHHDWEVANNVVLPGEKYEDGKINEDVFSNSYNLHIYTRDITDKDVRCHPILVECVESLGEAANGRFSELKIVEIPDGINFTMITMAWNMLQTKVHRTWS